MKKKPESPKVDSALTQFFGGLRSGGMGPMGARSSRIENWLTGDDYLKEKTKLFPDDIAGIMFLITAGEEYGVPEFVHLGENWMKVLVARDGERAAMMMNTLIAQIASDLQIAMVEAKKAEISQRERIK